MRCKSIATDTFRVEKKHIHVKKHCLIKQNSWSVKEIEQYLQHFATERSTDCRKHAQNG